MPRNQDKQDNQCNAYNAYNANYPNAIPIRWIYQYQGSKLYILTILILIGIAVGSWIHFNHTGMPISLFVILLIEFHLSEFIWVSIYHRKTLCWDSFLLNHSWQYCIVMSFSVVEYIVESIWFPSIKRNSNIMWCGLIASQFGALLRLIAMFTAKHNFSHLIASKKLPEHTLVTHGIYYYMRHPGYFAWFWWAIGNQILLLNPICSVAFAIISWCIMKDQIQLEETYLIKMFGDDYINYKSKTPTHIPLIP